MHDVWSAEIPEQLARGLVASHFFGVLDTSELKRSLPNLCRIFRQFFFIFAVIMPRKALTCTVELDVYQVRDRTMDCSFNTRNVPGSFTCYLQNEIYLVHCVFYSQVHIVFFLQITCPGTRHLNDRNMLYLSVCILGQTKRTKSVFASFPLALNERMYFERVSVHVERSDDKLRPRCCCR